MSPKPKQDTVSINRAPVLTLWGAAVAERLGYDPDAALSLGKCLAGLNAQAKGRRLGIFGEPKAPEQAGPPKKRGLGEEFWVTLCGRPLPARNTPSGTRAVVGDKPIEPTAVRSYLARSFGEDLPHVRAALDSLAGALSAAELEEGAYSLYEQFRPAIAPGQRGWGQKGTLDLSLIRGLASQGR